MKEVKILHLMPKLLSLYGEHGNVAIMNKVLTAHGCRVTVENWESGDLSFDNIDLIYVGSGTEDNLAEAIHRLTPYSKQIRNSIESGALWLATGNAMSLFAENALNVLPYRCHTDTTKRYMGDVLTDSHFGSPLVGYINTGCKYDGIETPLFKLSFGSNLGNDKGNTNAEGIVYNGFFGTQLIGPVLVKNPHFLCHLATQIAGQEVTVDEGDYLKKAYHVTLQELQKRAGS